jgi:peptidyl-prolyl cis-trans isomerase C
LSAAPDDKEALAAARVKAQEAIDLLKERPDRFADLARDLSACPSAKQGGNLGQLTRGSTVPEVETFVFQLEEGQLCPVPVRSRYGYHVLHVERRVCGRPLPFEAVHEKIAAFLDDRVWRQAVRQYIELLIGSADIKGIDLKGSISPLVQ